MNRRDFGLLVSAATVTQTAIARSAIAFSTPASEVEMKPLVGLDGSPIRIDGLPANAFVDYVQYESVEHMHRNPDREWSYSGTNGFVSRMIASG